MLLVTMPVSKDKDTGIPAWADALAAPREKKGRRSMQSWLLTRTRAWGCPLVSAVFVLAFLFPRSCRLSPLPSQSPEG